MYYSMKEISEKTGLSEHSLRYYEKEGLLRDVARSEGGVRRYTEANLEALGLICCLKNTGMSLREIARFVRLSEEGEHTLEERCRILETHRQNVIAKIDEMRGHLEKVDHKLGCYSRRLEEYNGK